MHEKIHNRSKSRDAPAATDHWPGAQDHEQWLGEAWPTDQDQRPTGPGSKPPRGESQTPSSKPQAPYFEHIPVI